MQNQFGSLFARYTRYALLACMVSTVAPSVVLAGSVSQNAQQEQTRIIRGKVTDSQGLYLPGVYIMVKGTSIGTSSDDNGEFTLRFPNKKDATLVFSFVGMEKKEVPVGADDYLAVEMQEAVNDIDEVVAIGYQNMERKKVTAAMTTISAEEIENVPYASVDQILSGKVAGLSSISTSGEPGSNTIVNVRGSNSVTLGGVSYPLYVIDGMIYDVNDMPSAYGNNPLTAFNPNEIESIDILKDASAAAIYGSRGANGVIIIKTKKGALTQTPQVRINMYAGMGATPTLRDVVAGRQERQMKLDYIYNNYQTMDHPDFSMFLTDSLNTAFNNNTDWQDIFVQNSMLYNVDASVSGAFGDNQYRVSIGYYNEEGVIIGYALKRISPKLYLSLNPSDKVNFTVNFIPSFVDIDHGFGNGQTFPFDTWNFPSSLWALTDKEKRTYTGQVDNLDEDKTMTLATNAQLNIKLTPSLSFTSSFSNNYRSNRRDYLSSQLLNGGDGDVAQNWNFETTIWEIENYLSYFKDIKGHNFSIIAGQQASKQTNKSTEAWGNNVLGNTIFSLSPGPGLYASTYLENKTRVGFFGRFNYDYKSKYLFSSSYRRDASSRYNAARRWADFYSASLGWNVAEESFFEPATHIINQLKLRGSYGVTGNDPASYYAQYAIYSSNATYDGSSFGIGNSGSATTYNGVTAISQDYSSYAADQNVTWEKYPQVNVGMDISFFKSRIDIQADWYARDAEDVFYSNLVAPATSGYGFYSGNAIDIRNTGYEFTLNTTNLGYNSKFKWNTSLTFAFNDNYITKLPEGGKDLTVGQPWLQQTLTVGRPLFTYRVWDIDGVYTSDADVPTDPLTGDRMTFYGETLRAGDPRFEDKNGDYNIDMNDKTYAGNPNPKVTGGFTNNFSYKNWSLSVFCNFILGRKVWNGYISDKLNGSKTNTPWASWGNVATLGILDDIDYYMGPGDTDADYGTLLNNRSNVDRFHIANSEFVEDASFFRIKNIMLGYNVPQKIGAKYGLSSLRFYGMVDNVLLVTNSTLPDPEAVGPTGHTTGNNYPLALKITLGLTATF